jgi:SAM-dependent methyltransferase
MLENELSSCQVCGSGKQDFTVKRPTLPVMQNFVYQTLEQALTSKKGQFRLQVCPVCGFACNADFDPELMHYDEGYDNNVPSSVMDDYYADLAERLYKKYHLKNRLVVDVGCGKGTFLKTLCRRFPSVRGLGIDPSFEGDCLQLGGRLTFLQEFFSESCLKEAPALVICRHVLEHIPDPVSFLKKICVPLKEYPETAFFFEVPDVSWIAANNSFWDFCYEHCNYFGVQSLSRAVSLAGMNVEQVEASFGEQYIWLDASFKESNAQSNEQGTVSVSSCYKELMSYADDENDYVQQTEQMLKNLKRDGYKIAVWGMATKGVLFSLLMDSQREMIDFCIDVNKNKQNCYVPTGHFIEAPEVLQKSGGKLAVIVMNPNYAEEISEIISSLSLNSLLIDAKGRILCSEHKL